MTTLGFISRLLSQTLVYWANPVNDGYGHSTFDDPTEISGRCEYKKELVRNNSGNEVLGKARIFLEQEVSEGEYLYLGSLEDSDMDSSPDPLEVEGAMQVIAFEKMPRLGSSTEFLYVAYTNMK